MAGQIIPILPKTNFKLETNDGTVTHRIQQHVDVSAWTEGQVMTRVHAMTAGGTSTVVLNVYVDGHTAEDPSTDFKGTTALKAIALEGLSAGAFDVTDIGTGFGGMLLFELVLTRTTGDIDTDLSIDLAVKA